MSSELPRERGLLSASPGTPIPAQEIQSRQIEIGSRLHLTRLCQALCSATAHLLFRLPISFTGGELRERASARDLPRSRLSATYPPRIRCDTARCGGAGLAPPLRLTCDLPRCPRHAPARDGGTDATLLRGLTRPRASAAPTTLRRPTPSACRLPCPYERCCAHGAAAVPTSRRRLNAPLPHPRRCDCSDTMPPALPTRTAATPTALRRSPTLRRRLTYPCAAAAPTVLRRP